MSARGRVWKVGRTWHYEVRVGKRVVFADNTGAFAPIIAACVEDVFAARRVLAAGHGFRHSWDELVERAR